MEEPFLAKILPRLIDTMGGDYPEIAKAQNRIAEILTLEEESFIRTLKRGGNLLTQIMEHAQKQGNRITGDDAFKLKDTYGMPFEEIQLLAKDASLAVDVDRFQVLEQEAKERSRSTQKVTQQVAAENLFADFIREQGPSQFLGYALHNAVGKVTAIAVNDQLVPEIKEGEEGLIILDQTPFYAEMGGQIGDTGTLKGEHQLFTVANCIAPYKGVIAHSGKLEKGSLKLGMPVIAAIDQERRQNIANNHTATILYIGPCIWFWESISSKRDRSSS